MSQNQIPKMDFTTFLLSVSSAVYIGLGLIPSPDGSPPQVNLELARHNIDLLELMAEKTKGNLTPDEAKLMEHVLFETRMRFVEVQKQKN